MSQRKLWITLNRLFERVVPIIHAHSGHVDKYVGDGLLAVFGAPRRQGQNLTGRQHLKTDQRRAEKAFAAQHEKAYLRMITDWQASRPAREKVGAGATPGRASQRPSKGKAARQTP